MKLIISTHFFFLSKIVKAFLLIKCHAKGFARERGEGIRAGAGEGIRAGAGRIPSRGSLVARNCIPFPQSTSKQI